MLMRRKGILRLRERVRARPAQDHNSRMIRTELAYFHQAVRVLPQRPHVD